jgi:hypothetical protein
VCRDRRSALAGFVPVRVPRSKNSFTAGEIFIFLLLSAARPAAAALAAAGEALVGSWRTSKRWTSRIVSPRSASIAMYGAGSLLSAGIAAAAHARLVQRELPARRPPLACAICHSVHQHAADHRAAVPQAQPVADRRRDVLGNFGWVGIHLRRQARRVACLLFLTFQAVGHRAC